jgi:D-alanyl-D-alanine endopeptidase (penicillin-binding protein 7)
MNRKMSMLNFRAVTATLALTTVFALFPAVSFAATPLFNENPVIAPHVTTKDTFTPDEVTAKAVYIIDVNSQTPLLAINEDKQYPIASLTKLMTALVSLDKKISMNKSYKITSADEVGGARLANTKRSYTINNLFYAMLVGSANNATNAVARSTGLNRKQFVAEMNAKAKSFGLANTTFVDPTGIELENISTPKEVAALALRAYDNSTIKKATTTQRYKITTSHTIKNTNGLLLDDTNGLYVLGGKTGYLPEIGWNLAVKMRNNKNKPILVVVVGSDTQKQSFKDAEKAANWAWDNFSWK